MGSFRVDDEVVGLLNFWLLLKSTLVALISNWPFLKQVYLHRVHRCLIRYCPRSPQCCWSVSVGGPQASLWIYYCSGEFRVHIYLNTLQFLNQLDTLWCIFNLQDISLENVSSMYELSEAFHAVSLRHTCILFILEHFDKLNARPGYVLISFCLTAASLSLMFKLKWYICINEKRDLPPIPTKNKATENNCYNLHRLSYKQTSDL